MSSPAVTPSVALAHLLIVDDNNVGLLARKSLLEEQGYRVTAVATPQDALNRLVESAFDAIITDHKLPLMSGVDFIKRIRSEGITAPVILLSGFVDALGLDERNTGANVVLQKCSNEFSHLCRALRTVLRARLEPKPPRSQKRVASGAARTRSKRSA